MTLLKERMSRIKPKDEVIQLDRRLQQRDSKKIVRQTLKDGEELANDEDAK